MDDIIIDTKSIIKGSILNTYNYEIQSGIEPEELQEYFSSIANEVKCMTHFEGEGWVVEIDLLPNRVHHSIQIPSTRIRFSGDQNICEKLIYTFRKKFMRGGG